MSLRQLVRLWLPLALSFEFMMLEGPAFHAAVSRLPDSQLNLAAWGLTMSVQMIVESPIIMLISTAIALVDSPAAYRALLRFSLALCAFCTLVALLLAATPLHAFVTRTLMGQPERLAVATLPAMRIMVFWSAFIGMRRFYQGVLVKHGRTKAVSQGTAIRLFFAIASALLLVLWGRLPGVQVAACAVMAAVISESVAAYLFARPVVSRSLSGKTAGGTLSQAAIFRFHAPLATTTLLALLAMPLTAAALARLPHRDETLAALPVAFMLLLVIRGFGLSLQEIAVAHYSDPDTRPALVRLGWIVGLVSSAVTVVVALSPLLDLYARRVIGVPPHLMGAIREGVLWGGALPLLTALASLARGRLMAERQTIRVYRGMLVGLFVQALGLGWGVWSQEAGMICASTAFTAGALAELGWLAWRPAARATGTLHPANSSK